MTLKTLLNKFLLCIALLGMVGCGGCNKSSEDPKKESNDDASPRSRKIVVLLHGLASSPTDMLPLIQYLQSKFGDQVAFIAPLEPKTFENGIEKQAANLYKSLFQGLPPSQRREMARRARMIEKLKKKKDDQKEEKKKEENVKKIESADEMMKKAKKVAFVCFSQGGPRLVAMRRLCAKAMRRLDKKGKKFVGDIFVACPLEGTYPVTEQGKRIARSMVNYLKSRSSELAELTKPLEVLLNTQGAGVNDLAPDSKCTKANVAYLKESNTPMLAIAGDKGDLLDKLLPKFGVHYLNHINSQISALHDGDNAHDLLVPVKSALAQTTNPPQLTRHTVSNTLHGPAPGMPESSVFLHSETLDKIEEFLKKRLELD